MSETIEITHEDILDMIVDDDIENFKKNIGKVDINAEVDNELNFGTLLHNVIYNLYATDEVLDILLEAGADINRKNKKNGDTPLHIAVELEDYYALRYLLNKGADYSIQNKFFRTPKEDALVVNNHKAVNIINFYVNVIKPIVNYDELLDKNHSLLLISIWNQDIGSIKKQIGNLFDINQPISFFGPALHTMVAVSNLYNEIDILLEAGADINQLSQNEGKTPLHLAVQWDDYNSIEHLLNKGANPFIKDKHGSTSIDFVSIKPSSVKDMINEKILKMAKDRYFEQMAQAPV